MNVARSNFEGAGVMQGTRRRYRRLFAEGEGGASGASAGCFPDFYTPQDFEDWLQGSFQGEPLTHFSMMAFLFLSLPISLL